MKYNYYVMSINEAGDEFEILKTNSKEEAKKIAKEQNYINKRDKTKCKVEIRSYEDDIEDPECQNFDYNLISQEYIAWCLFNDEQIESEEYDSLEGLQLFINKNYTEKEKKEYNNQLKICKMLCENGFWIECLEEYDLNGNKIN